MPIRDQGKFPYYSLPDEEEALNFRFQHASDLIKLDEIQEYDEDLHRKFYRKFRATYDLGGESQSNFIDDETPAADAGEDEGGDDDDAGDDDDE